MILQLKEFILLRKSYYAIQRIIHLRYTIICDKIYIDVSGEILMSLPNLLAMSRNRSLFTSVYIEP